ncbi:hypothetical protein [Sanguibacter massiliensis]|uniref:hypothetical protein n=1 Tax=Sanguibacter massiliensis TaxID=1973217 RepID=UPI000C825CB0|nr:hypothetical protein [Sanguibacter massiliensis]
MSDYTPTTEQVREAASPSGAVAVEPDAFSRWLAAHDRETAARAWDEGYTVGYGDGTDDRDPDESPNPYREEEADRG